MPLTIIHHNAIPRALPDPYQLPPPHPPYYHDHGISPSPAHTPLFEAQAPIFHPRSPREGGWRSPAPHPAHGYFPHRQGTPPGYNNVPIHHPHPIRGHQTPPAYGQLHDAYPYAYPAPAYGHLQTTPPPGHANGYMYYSPPQQRDYVPMQIPEQAYYIQPPRPSSAEPQHSTITPQPPVVEPVTPVSSVDPIDEGTPVLPTPEDPNKGARARRVSHHLRQTTRTRGRSVSPPASKSHILPPAPQQSFTLKPVLSPRPMLSPRQSYDEFAPGRTSAKSERVVELEQMVEEYQGNKNEPRLDKTLPKAPEPSGSVALEDKTEHEEELDVMELIKGEGILPLSNPQSQVEITVKRRVGGLEALETRLAAEVGTRKISGVPIMGQMATLTRAAQIGTLRSQMGALERRLLTDVGTRKLTPLRSKPSSSIANESSQGKLLPPEIANIGTG